MNENSRRSILLSHFISVDFLLNLDSCKAKVANAIVAHLHQVNVSVRSHGAPSRGR